MIDQETAAEVEQVPFRGLDLMRQMNILHPAEMEGREIHLIGCGGIGSPVAVALCKMGITNLTLWDNDLVEEHNLPNQMFPFSAINQPKAIALAEECYRYSGYRPETRVERYEGQELLSDIVISGVDNMAARKQIWEHLQTRTEIGMYIDGRMGAEIATIYTLDPTHPDMAREYETRLYDDDAAVELTCTARSIIYNTLGLAGYIGALVKHHLKGKTKYGELILSYRDFVALTGPINAAPGV